MKVSVLFLAAFFLYSGASAQLSVAKIFTNDMVFQRDRPVRIWGKGIPDRNVKISLGTEFIIVKVQPDSSWIGGLAGQKADISPHEITISCGSNRITLRNVLFGDVWLCLGQSNMEWPMIKEAHFREEIKHADNRLLRFFNPDYAGKNIYGSAFTDSTIANLTIPRFYRGRWEICDSSSLKTMSAVGYYFGKRISSEKNIPVGIINLSIGGAPVETFISRDVLKNNPEFSGKVNSNWLYNDALPVWIRERGIQNVDRNPDIPGDELGPNHAYKPGFAYEAGIRPIIRMPVKGILWYQGESNAQEMERVYEYDDLFKLMVKEYRRKWKDPSMPIYYVQLSSIDTANYKGQFWPEFRNEQRKCMERIRNTGMAVCSDIGSRNSVHPTDKMDVGYRLARWALNKTYHEDIMPSGPLPVKAGYIDGFIVIGFKYTGDHLMTSDGKPLRGFSINGMKNIHAIITGDQVKIRVNEKPEFVYYGWEPYTEANLVNSENLPASTFKVAVKKK